MAKTSSLASSIYGGAADFGRFQALLGLVIAVVIGLGLIGVGIYLLLKKQKGSALTAKIVQIRDGKSECQITADKQMYNCDITVEFNYNGQDLTKHVTYTGNSAPSVGQLYQITYDPSTDTVSQGSFPYKLVGGIMVGASVVIILFAYISYWAARKYQFAAAAEGVAGAVGMLRQR